MRILHTSDLHLGKPFGRFPEELRHRLREARHEAIARLAAAARDGGAGLILVAGDIFDAETPAPATLRQALDAMAADPGLLWVLMPGNHDSLAATDLWDRLAAARPANVLPALEARPLSPLPGLALLPAPCTARRPGRDLTAWMEGAETEPGAIRLGLAHGAIQDFSEEGNAALIPPDRAERAGLDYLALGDWHGEVRVGSRTAYSGTPEPDGFRHDRAGALLVTIEGPGAPPLLERAEVARFAWAERRVDLLPDDPADVIEPFLASPRPRRDTLLRLVLSGRVRPAGRAALLARIAAASEGFASLEAEEAALETLHAAEDLDLIDRAGALREAAEALLAEAGDAARPPEDRATAAAALDLLHAFARDAR